ncbi:SDR family oxidoreductase [Ancylomarina sp. DW003]|nr:SDR family NAD(P)-dependent oxidoreductase [Ancylomarina sp. DW003]MDE5422035.1 SDR family oxidoreductase [Ancylomarina sp. DW003]
MKLLNKVALVTGSNKGIGKAIAFKLAEEGAKIIVAARNEKEASDVVNLIIGKGGEAVYVNVDISDYDSVKNMVNQAIEIYGKIDILVNNAGVSGDPKLLHDISLDEWDNTFNINLKGTFLCFKEVVPFMIKQKWGRIINISSMGGIESPPFTGAYNASKAAIISLTKNQSFELARFGITANCVAPGLVETDLSKDGLGKMAKVMHTSSEEIIKTFISRTPIQRLIDSEEIANAVSFLASPASGAITGETIKVAGGGLM